MLFSFPVEAVAENWLHEAFIALILAVHADVDGGVPYIWPDSIPEAHRDKLSTRPALRDRLVKYRTKLAKLSQVNRNRVRDCLLQQNDIPHLLDGTSNCEFIDALPKSIRAEIHNLFSFAFDLLKSLSIRDRHYAIIYSSDEQHVCPFCGIEYFDAPGAPREDLDHYLAISIYPFAAANLRNLAPMGMKCNEKYKLAQNIIYDARGQRRLAFDPYNAPGLEISLAASRPFSGEDQRLPAWEIDFVPNTPQVDTWDCVFHIRERYQRDVLNPFFSKWLSAFESWFRRKFKNTDIDDNVITDALSDYIKSLDEMALTGRDALRIPVFEMLQTQLGSPNERLRIFLRELVAPPIPQ